MKKLDYLADFILCIPVGTLLYTAYPEFQWQVLAFIFAFSSCVIIRDTLKSTVNRFA